MKRLLLTIKPLTAFASPMVGAMLFGQTCWSLREGYGQARLQELLEGYCENRPFAVCSDAFPHGYLPLPAYPLSHWISETDTTKEMKRKKWLAAAHWPVPIQSWRTEAKSDREVFAQTDPGSDLYRIKQARSHNSINRMTHTTSAGGMFAPYESQAEEYSPSLLLDLYIDFDDQRISDTELKESIRAIGQSGFGRDASIGLGKFEVQSSAEVDNRISSRCVMTLSASVLNGTTADPRCTFYNIQTYFGRHGNIRALGQAPFKKPVLMAATGAYVVSRDVPNESFIGRGLKGMSAHKDTVHQAYAPIVNLVEIAS